MSPVWRENATPFRGVWSPHLRPWAHGVFLEGQRPGAQLSIQPLPVQEATPFDLSCSSPSLSLRHCGRPAWPGSDAAWAGGPVRPLCFPPQYEQHVISPKEFVHLAGKSTLKDWKRAIRMNGIMLRWVLGGRAGSGALCSSLCLWGSQLRTAASCPAAPPTPCAV